MLLYVVKMTSGMAKAFLVSCPGSRQNSGVLRGDTIRSSAGHVRPDSRYAGGLKGVVAIQVSSPNLKTVRLTAIVQDRFSNDPQELVACLIHW